MCPSNTTKFYYVYYCIRATCLDFIESSSDPSKITDPYLAMFKMRCGIPKNVSVWDSTAHFKHCQVRVCVLEGPEDDYIRIETCCPSTIINIIEFCCV